MNEKGQTLVLFLFLLPLILFLFLSFYDMGTRALEKRKMEKTIEEILEYGLNNLGEENLSETLANRFLQEFPTMNERDIEIEISDTIHITVFKRYTRSLLKNQTLELSYEGEIINGKVQIVKE